MSTMGSHGPFGHLKHKLCSKERLGVKLAIWLPSTKSWESTRLLCVQVTCHIPLESSQQGLQLCFRPHIDRRSTKKVMGPPKSWESQVCEFWDSHLGIPGQNAIWMWPSWKGTEYKIRGKVVVSPKSKPWWILWVRGCLWLVLAPKVLKLCTN